MGRVELVNYWNVQHFFFLHHLKNKFNYPNVLKKIDLLFVQFKKSMLPKLTLNEAMKIADVLFDYPNILLLKEGHQTEFIKTLKMKLWGKHAAEIYRACKELQRYDILDDAKIERLMYCTDLEAEVKLMKKDVLQTQLFRATHKAVRNGSSELDPIRLNRRK